MLSNESHPGQYPPALFPWPRLFPGDPGSGSFLRRGLRIGGTIEARA